MKLKPETDGDARDRLIRAWAIVDGSNLPEHLQPTALHEVLQWLDGERAPSKDTQGSARRGARTKPQAPATPEDSRAPASQDISEDDFFSALSRDSEVSEDLLREVFVFMNGKLELTPRNSKLGADSAERYRTVAVLMVPVVRILEDVKTVDGRTAKEHAERHGASDPSRNYAKYVTGIPGYTYVGDRKKKGFALRPGWETEFASTINRVLDKVSE